MKKSFAWLQKLGKALMLPISVLPIAGILMRIGQPDLLNIPFFMNAGGALFDNLPLLFAVGIAFGLSKDSHGAAALSGAIAYFVVNESAQAINIAIQTKTIFATDATDVQEIQLLHFGGIVAGLIASFAYNKFSDTKLPEFLSFFGGRRFVPIMTGLFSLIVGAFLGVVWHYFEMGLSVFSNWMFISGGIGAFLYGFLNRLLIPFGLHHVVNTFVWFMAGTFTDSSGVTVSGDINRFFHLDPSGGTFTAGFFPITMFALPACALAMYFCSKKESRKKVGGLLFSVAFVAFLTGITEPIEFLFIFSAPFLFVFHSVMMGVSLAVCQILNIHDSFTFSSGFFDYILNFGIAQKPLLLILLGLIFGAIYFIVFSFVIKKFDIQTPGRGDESMDEENQVDNSKSKSNDLDDKATQYLKLLGGKDNIQSIESCITRLRLDLKDNTILDESELKKLGASGVLKVGDSSAQIIIGTQAELLCDAIKNIINKN